MRFYQISIGQHLQVAIEGADTFNQRFCLLLGYILDLIQASNGNNAVIYVYNMMNNLSGGVCQVSIKANEIIKWESILLSASCTFYLLGYIGGNICAEVNQMNDSPSRLSCEQHYQLL